jgi:DNA polymerase (family 10)
MDNAGIAQVFAEMAQVLEIEGANVFKIRALRNAAEAIESLPHEVATLAAEPERLRDIPGIGAGIAKKIIELCETGSLREHQELLERFPASLLELLEIPGVGPKKVALFRDALGVRSIADLEAAARAGKVRDLPRMSAKTEESLLKAIDAHRQRSGRFLLTTAEAAAARLSERLGSLPGIRRLELAGSLRRRRETVGDLDLLVSCDDPAAVIERFAGAGEVAGRGETKCSIRLAGGLQADLRVVPLESFGAAWHYFTGSKAHNIAVRTMGVRKGLTINEYGVYEVRKDGSQGKRVGGESEEDVFRAVGLPWIPPELRENRGEIEAALAGKLPRLLELADIKGDVHVHTTATDGSASIEEMALAAAARGLEYIAITDHSQALAMTGGLDEARLRAQVKEVARVNRKLGRKIRVLSGIEVDILRDGALDLAVDALGEVDVVVASIHSAFNLDRDAMTERLVRAIESGAVDIIGHPTGRILTRRDPYPLDMERILRAAKERGVAMESSAQPNRLDLSDSFCRLAQELGVRVAISTDAHSPESFDLLRFGVENARRGWLGPRDVLNTLGADAFLEALHAGHRP